MHPMITAKLDEVAALCRRYHVRRLDLFGSATTARFDPATSDLDFVVDFEPGPTFREYFEFREALEALFDRSVDLVSARKIINPYFAESVETSRQTIYAVS